MATTTPNFGWTVPTSTDLVKDGATAIETLGDSIDASFVDLKGGTTGQVLSKASGTDLDFTWVAQDDSNAIQNAIVDAKGDLIAATAADTPARLAVGANGTVLTADSAEATGLKWAAVSSGALTLLSTTSFSAVSSVSLPTDSFTSTYDDYLVLLNVTSSSADQYIQGRLRAAGSDNTASTYGSSYIYQQMATGTVAGQDNGGINQNAFAKLSYSGTSKASYNLIYVRSPKATRRTYYSGSAGGYGFEGLTLAGYFDNTTSFDSMTFFVAGNFTGAVSVYGISK